MFGSTGSERTLICLRQFHLVLLEWTIDRNFQQLFRDSFVWKLDDTLTKLKLEEKNSLTF